MIDTIALRGMRVWGHHGANPGERDAAQPFDIDLELSVDLRAAAASDALEQTIDYSRIHALVAEIVQARSYALLERIAGEVLAAIFGDPRIAAAAITIAKPQLLGGATPSVTLRRLNPAAW